jgi:hypothetical protein
MASRLLRLHFRGLHDVHFRYGPHAALPSLKRGFLGVLQAIRRLLARPKYFRPEREWPGGYLTHGTRAPLQGTHNNYCENQIRPFAVGRRAWLFVDSHIGATASANLYSIVMTCRANGVEPYAYLCHLFEEFPKADTAEQLEALLPWNAKAAVAVASTIDDAELVAQSN